MFVLVLPVGGRSSESTGPRLPSPDRFQTVTVDSPELVAAKRLLDAARASGFAFERIGPGEDAPLRGTRTCPEWSDEVYVGGFSEGCTAIRRRRSSLIVPGGMPVAQRVSGDAITVLHTVVADWPV